MPKHAATKTGRQVSVFEQLLDQPAVTVSEIADRTGLSRPTVSGILEAFEDRGLAASHTEVGTSRAGRPASQWRLAPAAGFVVSLDLRPTRALATSARLDGHTLGTRDVRINAEDPRARFDDTVRLLTQEREAQVSAGCGALRAVTVSTTGIVDAKGTILRSKYAPGWAGLPLAERLSERLAVPVRVENDVNCAAYGEFVLRRDGREIGDDADLVYIHIDDGLVTGLTLGGRLHRGSTFTAGEFGVRLSGRDGDRQARLSQIMHSVGAIAAVLDPSVIVVSSTASDPEILTEISTRTAAHLDEAAPQRLLERARLGVWAACVGALALALDDARTGLVSRMNPARRGPVGFSVVDPATGTEHAA